MAYTYQELKDQMPDAIHIYIMCTQADCDAMTEDFFRVDDGLGTFAIGCENPVEALADREVMAP